MQKYFGSLATKIRTSVFKFPLTYLLILVQIVLLGIIVVMIDAGSVSEDTSLISNLGKLAITVEIAIILSAPAAFWVERAKASAITKTRYAYSGYLVATIVAAVFGLMIHWYSLHRSFAGFEWQTGFALLFATQAAAWVAAARPHDDKKLWLYIHNYILQAAINFFFALLLFAGVAGLLLAASALFSLNIDSVIYSLLFSTLTIGGGHILFLSQLQRYDDLEFTPALYPRVWLVLNRFVVIPVMTGFAILLAVYFLTLITSGSLPANEITPLILAYIIPGAIGVFLQFPVKQEHKSFHLFEKFFWAGSLLAMLMYAYAVYLRIGSEGLTVTRMILIMLGILITTSAIVMLALKKAPLLAWVSAVGSIVLLAFFSPFSNIFFLSEVDQTNRLIALLESTGRVSNQTLVENSEITERAEYEEAASRLLYVANTHGLNRLDAYLTDDLTAELSLNEYGFLGETLYSYTGNKAEELILGESDFDYGAPKYDEQRTVNSELIGTRNRVKDISSYDYSIDLYFYINKSQISGLTIKEIGDLDINLKARGADIKILTENVGTELATVSLNDLAEQVFAEDEYYPRLPGDELEFTTTDINGNTFTFIFERLEFVEENGIYLLITAEGELLVDLV